MESNYIENLPHPCFTCGEDCSCGAEDETLEHDEYRYKKTPKGCWGCYDCYAEEKEREKKEN